MATLNEWFFPRGSLARDGWESVVDASLEGWQHTGIRVARLGRGPAEPSSAEGVDDLSLPAADVERLVIPLAGTFTVDHDDTTTPLTGRRSVFDGPTDVLYVGARRALSIRGTGTVAVAEAPTTVPKPSAHLKAADVPVVIRGAGRDTRQVHNFGTPDALDAASFIVCEVITPAGNWSSHPAHKHDVDEPGHESNLEEIYYFEVAPRRGAQAPENADAFATFATYASDERQIETNALVRSGDIALVPYGYHGPASAAPEYDLYYLNVMAGPGDERAWLISDDPRQAWLRQDWESQQPDPRLPYRPEAGDAV
jgi:5-deoxy-glucuronate isomerase